MRRNLPRFNQQAIFLRQIRSTQSCILRVRNPLDCALKSFGPGICSGGLALRAAERNEDAPEPENEWQYEMTFELKLERRLICMGGNDDQIIAGEGGPDRIAAQERDRASAHMPFITLIYMGTSTHLILNTLTLIFKSEHRRIRTIEGKAGMLLLSSFISVSLKGWEAAALLSAMRWGFVP